MSPDIVQFAMNVIDNWQAEVPRWSVQIPDTTTYNRRISGKYGSYRIYQPAIHTLMRRLTTRAPFAAINSVPL